MDIFANNLKLRAQELGLANAEVARRVGLSERRYAHYVSGRNEPDLALLIRICEVLRTNPNALLGLENGRGVDVRELSLQRLLAAASLMKDEDLQVAIAQAEAAISIRRR